MISIADIFVGSVAVVLGSLSILAAAVNYEAAFRLPKTQAIENRFGRGVARIVLALLGVILVGIGCAVIAGFAPNAERQTSRGHFLSSVARSSSPWESHTP